MRVYHGRTHVYLHTADRKTLGLKLNTLSTAKDETVLAFKITLDFLEGDFQ